MPPGQYRDIARRADCHLQLTIDEVRAAGGALRVSGQVVRMFRGDASLVGTPMTVEIDEAREDSGQAPPGSVQHASPARFRAGHILEAYVYHPGTRPQVPLDQYGILDRATDEPQLQIDVEPPSVPETQPVNREWMMRIVVALVLAGVVFALLR